MENLLHRAITELGADTSAFKILTYLSFRCGSLPAQIVDEMGMPAGTVRPALRTLLTKAFVIQSEDGTYKSKIAFTEIISDLYTRSLKRKT
jgi:DNA-binding IclR family transcriptional regulator